jgi:hypothetical protein
MVGEEIMFLSMNLCHGLEDLIMMVQFQLDWSEDEENDYF